VHLTAGALLDGELRLLRPLGDGATSSVWVAHHSGRDEEVAVKIAARELSRDPTALARFRREARLVRRMLTRHVPRGLGEGATDDGRPFVVMELLEGETLEQHLGRVDRLAPEVVVAIAAQTAEALDEAHAMGIVHRDIKPANLFLVAGHDHIEVKVLDFGMAKRLRALDPSVVTETGTAVGTPDYMSPEQLQRGDEVDHRADLWSLGVLVYRALFGRLPFVSGTFPGLCVAICRGVFPAPTTLDPALPRALDRWFERALAIDRERRFESASATVRHLRMVLAPRFRWQRGVVALLLGALALAGGALLAWLWG
jgi:serine/threonine-protein kinase